MRYTTIVVMMSVMLTGCGRPSISHSTGGPSGTLQVKGSDTMVNLVQAWAEVFMEEYPDIFVSVTGGGSGTGIASLFNGTADVASCSRLMSTKELQHAQAQGWTPEALTVARDGLAVVVHPENPVSQLTLGQLADIFTGRITNWRDVGGRDGQIVLLSREVNSGTHVYFKKHVLPYGSGGKEFYPKALLLPSSQAIADEVANNRDAIGYFGMGYIGPGQRVLALAQDSTGPFTLPTDEAIQDGRYPVSRPLIFYTRQHDSELVKLLTAFILSPAGQAIVPQQDFVAIQ